MGVKPNDFALTALDDLISSAEFVVDCARKARRRIETGDEEFGTADEALRLAQRRAHDVAGDFNEAMRAVRRAEGGSE